MSRDQLDKKPQQGWEWGYYRQVAATATDHSMFESTYRSCANCKLPQHVAATHRSNKSLRVYWRNFVKIFVFATEFCRRDKSHKILSDLIFCNMLLRQNSVAETMIFKKFSSTHEPICRCDVSCCSNLSPSVYRP